MNIFEYETICFKVLSFIHSYLLDNLSIIFILRFKENVIWSENDMNKIKQHIAVLYYEDGLEYYIKAIREVTEIPIVSLSNFN